MATFKDPVKCFATLEVIERLLEIRTELGFAHSVYVPSTTELADFFDAYGFSIYSFTNETKKIRIGDYRTPLVPGGEVDKATDTAH